MRVAFVTLEAREALAYGLMSLAAALRRHGHVVELVQGRDAAAVARDPRAGSADVLAMSTTTGLHRVYVRWAHALRRRFPDKVLVLGGPHPTFFPEVIAQAPLDGVCVGEGEESFPDFLGWLGAGGTPPDGWWIRRDRGRGAVERGRPRPPILDLDTLPTPAYDLFHDAKPEYARTPQKAFLATRGCPYRCTYCFNRTLNERYRPYGRLVRTRDPDAVVDDVLHVRRRWGVRLVWFLDANFVADRRWLEAFAATYRRRVGLPFMCKLRPERASERLVRTLVEANCTAVGVGIESGTERLRREWLGRPATDAEILEGCQRLKRFGLRVLSFSMLGIPTETLDEALRTVAFNVACGVDFGAATILQPYPATAIAERAIAAGLFDGDFDRLDYSYFGESPFAFPDARARHRITNLQRLFSYAVEFPEVRRRLRWLIDRPPSTLFRHLFEVRHGFAIRHTFYEADTRFPYRHAGTFGHLAAACRDLGLAPSPAAS
ncbi:MAG: B12-binding domain-containing radical SAM protein [Deltaproteobacteria bacterium]|nr:B12-binding domain-containing radical SAM protein [Deltaproteobacteria bacterium]